MNLEAKHPQPTHNFCQIDLGYVLCGFVTKISYVHDIATVQEKRKAACACTKHHMTRKTILGKANVPSNLEELFFSDSRLASGIVRTTIHYISYRQPS